MREKWKILKRIQFHNRIDLGVGQRIASGMLCCDLLTVTSDYVVSDKLCQNTKCSQNLSVPVSFTQHFKSIDVYKFVHFVQSARHYVAQSFQYTVPAPYCNRDAVALSSEGVDSLVLTIV